MNIVNLTEASRGENFQNGDFIEYQYDNGTIVRKHWYAPKEPSAEEKIKEERQWRDAELSATDWIVPVTDHPQHSAYLTYRQELRDYPSQADFPNGTRPQKP